MKLKSMKIQQFKEFQWQTNGYDSLKNSYYQNPISHVELFLYTSSGHIYKRGGPLSFYESLFNPGNESGITLDLVDLNIDVQNDMVYLSEVYDPYEHGMTEEEFNIKYNNMNTLQLCQNKIIDCAVMTKNHFIELLTIWMYFYTKTTPPFVLLYLDDSNEYNLLPFDTQNAMELFIKEHTLQTAIS